MYEALMKLIEFSLNIIFNLLICLVLFQFGITKLWPKYPFKGFKKGFFLFLALLGIYGFIRGLVVGW